MRSYLKSDTKNLWSRALYHTSLPAAIQARKLELVRLLSSLLPPMTRPRNLPISDDPISNLTPMSVSQASSPTAKKPFISSIEFGEHSSFWSQASGSPRA